MKKRICTILLAAVLMVSLLTPAAAAGKCGIYGAYSDLLSSRLEEVGYLPPSQIRTLTGSYDFYPDGAGVVYARLIDFEGDGVEELFLVESVRNKSVSFTERYDLVWTVYVPGGKGVQKLANGKLNLPQWGDYFGFATDGTGKSYFMEKLSNSAGLDCPLTFYTIENGKWVTTEFLQLIRYDWSGTVGDDFYHSSTGSISQRSINGDSVTKEVYDARKAAMTARGSEKYAASVYTSAGQLLPDSTPQAVLTDLRILMEEARRPAAWAAEAVEAAIGDGIVEETLQCDYDLPITRAEFCSLAVGFYESRMGEEIRGRMEFTDTDDENVQKMGAMGVVTGVGEGRFDPDGVLTREAAAVILMRLAASMGMPFPDAAPTFADQAAISPWALAQVGQAQAAGVMNGMGGNRFSPKTFYTREQSIVTIMRLDAILYEN